ncbi:MAG: hypothetical protein ABSA47_00025 [Verrucomicrobiota bacterium]
MLPGWRRIGAALALCGFLLPPPANAEGTWLNVQQPAPDGIGTMLLLSDGTVMAQGGGNLSTTIWYRLTPDSTGGYTNGTWSSRASMNYSRLYYSSDVLQDGRVFIAGAEYGNGTTNAEVYDPFHDSWTIIPVPFGLLTTTNSIDAQGANTTGFMDSGSVILSNGDVLVTPVVPYYYGSTVLFNPSSDTMSLGPTLHRGVDLDEASLLKLPDDSILVIDSFTNTSERYIPALNQWIADANVPVNIYDSVGGESGAAFLLPNGNAFYLGSTSNTAIYVPSGTTNAGAWTAGPNIPAGLGAPDAPAAMMVNGKILCAFSRTPYFGVGPPRTTNVFIPPTYFFEYDYSAGPVGAFTEILAPYGTFADAGTTYSNRMLDLPDGTVLFTDGSTNSLGGGQLFVYKPDASPLAAGKPDLQNISWNPDGTVHLIGTGFNGISQGAAYGDDAQMDSNYPLVRLTNAAGEVYYGTTYGWSSTSVMTGDRVVTTEAMLPTNIYNHLDNFSMQVVANGIASDPVTFNPLFANFNPLVNNEVVFDFSQIGGSVNESSAFVVFVIQQYDPSGVNNLFWNGSSWISNGNDPSVYLDASNSGGTWAPATGVTLPTRCQTRSGPYLLWVVPEDVAGNLFTNQILVTRSAPDTTTPVVTLDTVHSRDVITNNALLPLSGSALDLETGVASVTVYLNQFTSGDGVLYWTGTSWSSVSTSLGVSYNATTAAWLVTNPMPSGSDLPNAGYQVEVIVANNECPPESSDLITSFSVNYHPVYVYTAGSFLDPDPDNWNNYWSTPANWDVGSVPTSNAQVIINSGYSPDNSQLGSLQLYRLDMSGGALTTAGMLITNLNFSGGLLNGGAISLPSSGVFNWSGGTLVGIYNVSAGATLNLSGSADKTLYLASLTNNGAVYWNGGNILASYGSAIYNNATFVIQSSGFLYDNGLEAGYYALPVFVNNGWLQKTNSDGDLIVAPDEGGWIFNQNGTIDVENGAFSSQSAFNVNGGALFAGPGETRVDAGVVTINGTNMIQLGATVELTAGTVNGTGTFGGSGAFNWSGGVISAVLSLQTNLNFNVTGDGPKTLTLGSLDSAGHGLWTGAGPVVCSYGSLFQNDGAFTVQNDSSFTNNGVEAGYYGQPVFVNTGIFVKTNSANTTLFPPDNGGVAFNNQGAVCVQSGFLALGGGGSDATSTTAAFTVAAGSEIDLTAGDHFFGPGLVKFNGPGLIRLLTAGTLDLGGVFGGGNGVVNLTNGGAFELDAGGNLIGTGTFGGTGTFNWTGGVISAALSLQTNITFNLTGSADKTLFLASLTNNGAAYWNGGNIVASYGSAINNNANFVIQSSGFFYDNGLEAGYYSLPVFVNNGWLQKTNSNGVTIVAPDEGGWTFNQNGTIDVENGVLSSQGAFNVNGGAVFAGPGETRVDAGTLTINGTNMIQLGATVELAAGTLNGTGAFGGSGAFNWSGGVISAVLSLQTNLNFNVTGDGPKTLTLGALDSAAHGLWTGAGAVVCSYGSIFQNDGAFTVQNDSSFTNNGVEAGYYGQPVFVNNGIFVKTNSANTTLFPPDNGGVAFNNQGTVSVQSGFLALGGGGGDATAALTTAAFTAAAGSRIDFNGGAHLFGPGLISFNGPGLIRLLTAGSLSLGGNVVFNNGGAFELDAGGTVNGTGTFGGTGTFNWTGGVIAAALGVQANLTFNLTGSADKTLQFASLTNNSAAYWNGGNIVASCGSAINNNTTFVIQNSGFFYDNGVGAGYYGQPAFINNGTFRKQITTGATVFDSANGGVNFNNLGTVDLQTGTLAVNAGYTLSGSPRLNLALGGPNPGAQFSLETFAGSATLGGILSVVLTNSFIPTNGQSFAILTYGSETGQFASQQLPPLPGNLAWETTYGATAVTLSVVRATLLASPTLLANGHFQFSFSGPSATSALIQGSTNLVDWTSLQTNTPFSGALLFDDPLAAAYSGRFYRVLIQP